ILLRLGEELREHLDRHVAGEGLLIRLVDGRHSAATDLFDDQVRADVHARGQAHAPSSGCDRTDGAGAGPTEPSALASGARFERTDILPPSTLLGPSRPAPRHAANLKITP